MKKKAFIISIIFFAIINIWKIKSYGYIKTDYGSSEIVARGYSATQATTAAVLEDLQDTGYKGNELTNEMKVYTQITIIEVKNNKYKIVFRRYTKRYI